MKRKHSNLLLFAALFALSLFLFGIETTFSAGVDIQSLQEKAGENPRYSIDKNTQKLTFLSAAEGRLPLETGDLKTFTPQRVARKFFKVYGSYFGIRKSKKDLQAVEQKEESSGMVHIRYVQQHKGVKVFGGEILVHLNSDYSVSSANGRLVPQVKVNIHPKISRGMAEKAARELWQSEFGADDPETQAIELAILNKGILENKKDERDYLVWKIDLANRETFRHKTYFINARNGKLVYQRVDAVSSLGKNNLK